MSDSRPRVKGKVWGIIIFMAHTNMTPLTDEQRKLVESHWHVAHYYATRYMRHNGSSYDEALSSVAMAMVDAARRFDPKVSLFTTMLDRRVLGQVIDDERLKHRWTKGSRDKGYTPMLATDMGFEPDRGSFREDAVGDMIAKERLEKVMRFLSRSQQLLLRLKMIGMRSADIAKAIGVSTAWVHTNVTPLLNHVAFILEQHDE